MTARIGTQDPRLPAALYHCESALDRDPAFARDELRAEARARDMTIVLEVDDTRGGARDERPGLVRVLDAVRRGDVAVVLVWKLDRLGDSVADVLHCVCVLREAGCRLVVASQQIEVAPDDASSDALVAMLDALRELYRSAGRKRAHRGLQKARSTGKKIGRPKKDNAPDGGRVHTLRQRGRTWGRIAQLLQCTPAAARRAYERYTRTDAGSSAIEVEKEK